MALVVFHNPLLDKFVKPRVVRAFALAYPGYAIQIGAMSYSLLNDRIKLDSVAFSAEDNRIAAGLDSISVTGVGRSYFLSGGKLTARNLSNLTAQARNVVLTLRTSHYELHCDAIRFSVADSEAVIETASLTPSITDEQLFAKSIFRTPRYLVTIPRAEISKISLLELLQGKAYRARLVQIHRPFLDVLINKDKPYEVGASGPLMPYQLLASIKKALQVDSLSIVDGRLNYGERFAVLAKPALLTFDSMQVLIENITNQRLSDKTLLIQAQATFLRTGIMKLKLAIPSTAADLSFRYSGSLSHMNLSALNSFLEPAEQIRIKSGVLRTASYDINVASGRSTGYVRAIYTDLDLAVINKRTGSERGIMNRIASFIANTFHIRGSNQMDKSGSLKAGKVEYSKKHDEAFLEFAWFSLRSGVGDVVGF